MPPTLQKIKTWTAAHWREILIALCCLLMVFGFWATAVNTSWARIAALETIEPYGFAVHEQLLYNFSNSGDFYQTIHLGYDNTWTWSGHRAITLPLNGLLYGLDPSPLWLSKIQIFWMLSGAIPAAWLGRHVLGNVWGILLGAFFYLMSPALMALALQDYQDLVLATPFLMWTICAMYSGSLYWVILGAIIGCMPREECVPLVLATAMVVYPGNRRLWLRNIAAASGVAVFYFLVINGIFPLQESQHDMPLVNAIKQVTQWPPQLFLDGWPYLGEFYSLLWAPIGLLAIFAPEILLPGILLIFLHMTVPWGHGVDRSWGAHVHHMGPALPFFTAAAIVGTARLLKWLQKQTRIPRATATVLSLSLAAYAINWCANWGDYYRLKSAFTITSPTYTHPVWTLAENHLSPEDIPIVSSKYAVAVSSRTRSYTYNESLYEKAPGKGLAAGTHLIADSRKTPLIDWAMAMPGAQKIAEEGPFVLITWTPGASDPSVRGFSCQGTYQNHQDMAQRSHAQLETARKAAHRGESHKHISAECPASSQLPQCPENSGQHCTSCCASSDHRPWPGMPADRNAIEGVPPRKAPPPPPKPRDGKPAPPQKNP